MMTSLMQHAAGSQTRLDAVPGRDDMPICTREETYLTSRVPHEHRIEAVRKKPIYNKPDPKKPSRMKAVKGEAPTSGEGFIAEMNARQCIEICGNVLQILELEEATIHITAQKYSMAHLNSEHEYLYKASVTYLDPDTNLRRFAMGILPWPSVEEAVSSLYQETIRKLDLMSRPHPVSLHENFIPQPVDMSLRSFASHRTCDGTTSTAPNDRFGHANPRPGSLPRPHSTSSQGTGQIRWSPFSRPGNRTAGTITPNTETASSLNSFPQVPAAGPSRKPSYQNVMPAIASQEQLQPAPMVNRYDPGFEPSMTSFSGTEMSFGAGIGQSFPHVPRHVDPYAGQYLPNNSHTNYNGGFQAFNPGSTFERVDTVDHSLDAPYYEHDVNRHAQAGSQCFNPGPNFNPMNMGNDCFDPQNLPNDPNLAGNAAWQNFNPGPVSDLMDVTNGNLDPQQNFMYDPSINFNAAPQDFHPGSAFYPMDMANENFDAGVLDHDPNSWDMARAYLDTGQPGFDGNPGQWDPTFFGEFGGAL